MQSTKHTYSIRVKGYVNLDWSAWFEQITVEHKETGETVLSGELPDQTALHGVLAKIRDLGIILVEVKSMESDPNS